MYVPNKTNIGFWKLKQYWDQGKIIASETKMNVTNETVIER